MNSFDLSRLKGFRFPGSVIGYAALAYHRFALNFRDVEDFQTVRDIMVSYETIQDWATRFGALFAAKVRQGRLRPSEKWQLDEMLITIKGKNNGSGEQSM